MSEAMTGWPISAMASLKSSRSSARAAGTSLWEAGCFLTLPEGNSLTYGESSVYTSDPAPVDSPFTYLTLLIASLDDVSLSLYDGQGTLTYTAWFDTGTQTILGEPAQ